MCKTVFDTNVFISAFITKKGKAERPWFLAIEGKIEVHVSVAILTEMAKKLREKFFWDDGRIKAAIKHIARVARIVKPGTKLHILTDEPDNRILECAQHVKAVYIVTGDRHLLDLSEWKGIKIVMIAEFLKIMEGFTYHE